MKPKISQKTAERIVYVLIIIILVIYGVFKDSAAADALIRAVKDAFSILIHTPFLAAAVVLLLGLFFLAVVVFGLLFSYIFWAYENKDDNVSVIKNALSFSIKNIFSVIKCLFICILRKMGYFCRHEIKCWCLSSVGRAMD